MAVSMTLPVPSAGNDVGPAWLQVVDRGLRVIEWVFETLALAALAIMAVFTTVNVIARYFFAAPIPGSLNMILLYLMPPLIFLALGRVQATNAHIAATLFVDRMGERAQRFCRIVVTLVILVTVVLMTWGALRELLEAWGKTLGGTPELPIGPSWIFVPLGLAAISLRALWQLACLVLVPGELAPHTDLELPVGPPEADR
jgi:TRAP-type C4-dicarboxylate transport system permease small subunit